MKKIASSILSFLVIVLFMNMTTQNGTTTKETSLNSCEPEMVLYTCGGYPSQHPHWRFGLVSATGTGISYSWSATNFTITSPTNASYIVGQPTSAGYFTIYCTATYDCPRDGLYLPYVGTFSLSETFHTSNDCEF